MKYIATTIALCSLLALIQPPPVFGQVVSQTLQSSWTLDDTAEQLSFEPFDSQNGTRELIGISIGFEGFVDLEVLIQNFSTLELEENDWSYDAGANVFLAFQQKPGYEDGGPFFGLGGPFRQGISGRLSAGSGGTPFSNPTAGNVDVTATASAAIDSLVTSNANLDYFVSDQPLIAQTQPFLDFILTPPAADPSAFINGTAIELIQEGEITLSYEFVATLGRPEDCNADGVVDLLDLDCVCDEQHADLENVLSAAGLIKGDLDGDGEVGFADFLKLSDAFGEVGGYTSGDIDCSGVVDFPDFLALSANFGSSVAATSISASNNQTLAAVPEPSAAWPACLAAMCLVSSLRRAHNRS